MNENGDMKNVEETDHFGRYPTVFDFVQAVCNERVRRCGDNFTPTCGNTLVSLLGITKVPKGVTWEVAGVTNYKVTSATVQYECCVAKPEMALLRGLVRDHNGESRDEFLHLMRMCFIMRNRMTVRASMARDGMHGSFLSCLDNWLIQVIDAVIESSWDQELLNGATDLYGFDDTCYALILLADSAGLPIGYGGFDSVDENILADTLASGVVIRKKARLIDAWLSGLL